VSRLRTIVVGFALVGAAACGDDVTIIDARGDGGPAPTDGAVSPDGGVVLHPEPYVEGPAHSPLTPFVVESLRAVRARGAQDEALFAKVGDSITVSNQFLHCFDGDSVDLDGRPLEGALEHFAGGDAAGTSPFGRESVAAAIGWHAGRVLEGSPSPLEQEVAAIDPAFALVMFGTNDIGIVPFEDFANNLLDIADQLLDQGIVPIFSTFPPRGDDPSVNAEVPSWNLAVRAVAEARQVPLIDLHQALVGLPDFGLGGDALHPSAFASGACVLTSEALEDGYNVRNLLSAEALARVHAVLVEGGSAPDVPGAPLAGSGTHADPWVIDRLPFTHGASTLFSEERLLSLYTGCDSDSDESGPELVYRLELDAPATLRLNVFDRGETDIDLHVLSALDEGACVERAHREIEVSLAAGSHFVVLDTFVSSRELAGEYLLTIAAR
jgi:hypothetical protein